MNKVSENNFDFQEIYKTFQPRILRYLARLVGKNEAEDLTQEVFIKIGRGLKDFRGKSQLSTWIYRIATNAALDKLRSPYFQQTIQKRLMSNSDVEGEEHEEHKDVWTGEIIHPIDQDLIRKEMNECLRSFIENLPDNYRTIIVLSELEGLKNREIAVILGVSLDTVKIRQHRARLKLKKELEAHCIFYRDDRNELACDLKSAFEGFRNAY